jgi:hypothetical protein
MERIKAAVLFTGKIYTSAFDSFLEQTKNIEHKFASIWENEEPIYKIKLLEHNFTVIENRIDQQLLYTPASISIVNGFQRIKEEGFDVVLKTRFDVISSDYTRYLDVLQKGDRDKINVLSGIHTDILYFLEIMAYGTIENMCKFYTLHEKSDPRCPEVFAMETYSGKQNLSKEDISSIFTFSLPACREKNIEFIWYRPPWWKTSFRTIPDMRVISEYCTDTFIWV